MREGMMSNARRSPAIDLRWLIAALAIQAMTPDARDLTSLRLFQILCAPLDPALLAGATSAGARGGAPGSSSPSAPVRGEIPPLGSDDGDEFPDEICVPRRLQSTPIDPRQSSG